MATMSIKNSLAANWHCKRERRDDLRKTLHHNVKIAGANRVAMAKSR